MSTLIPLNTANRKRYIHLPEGIYCSPVPGHGLALSSYISSKLLATAPASDGKAPKNRKDERYKAGDMLQISFGNLYSTRYELIVSPNKQLQEYGLISAPSVLSPKEPGELLVNCILYKDCSLRELDSLITLYLVD